MDQHPELEQRWEQAAKRVLFRESPLDDEVLSLEYENDLADLTRATQVHVWSENPVRRLVFLQLMLLGMLALMGASSSLVVVVALFVFLWTMLAGMPKRIAQRLVREEPAYTQTIHVLIDADNLEVRQTDAWSVVDWSRIRRITETRDLFLIYPNKFMFWAVPKRAFAGEEQLQRFRDLAAPHVTIEQR